MGRRLGSTNAEKRNAVLEAAAVVVAARGRQATLAEICRLAGVSRQTVYNHYRDKEGLLEAVAAQWAEPCPCCSHAPALPPEILLSRYAARLLEWTYATQRVTALRACCRGLETWDATSFGAREPAIPKLAAVLRDETLSGRLSVADPKAAAALFLDLVLAGPQLRIVLGTQAQPSLAEIEDLSSHCARVFVRGCSEPRPHPPPRPAGERAASPRLAPDDTSFPAS